MSSRPFRFGVTAPGGASAQDWLDLARKVEDLGYSTLLPTDHFRDQLTPLPAIMAAAGVTKRLRLGTLVLDNDFRHPAVLAKEAATIDLLTGGRLELGLGAGWLKADYEKAGLSFDAPGVRLARFMEAVEIIKRFLSGEEVTFQGKYYQVDKLNAFPPAEQQPVPILIGGSGTKMLSFAAQQANIVNISNRNWGLHFSTNFRSTLEILKGAAGSRYEQLELNSTAWHVRVTGDVGAAAEELAARMNVPPEAVLDSPSCLVGSAEAIVEQLQARREQFALSYWVIAGEAVDDFGPIVARLAGT